jgi:chaperonin cofactor prefoldin
VNVSRILLVRALIGEYLTIVLLIRYSASYAGLKDWENAITDAKECIRLDPTFVKGYYRLALALIEAKEWDKALAAIKQGLAVESNNPQLLKQIQQVKLAQKRDSKKNAAPLQTRVGGLDSATSMELQELQAQYVQTSREISIAQANVSMAQREYKANEITKAELDKVSEAVDTKMYRSVGKMFLLSSRSDVVDHLTQSMQSDKRREAELTQKLEYLEKRLKSQRLNIEELVKAPSVAE